MSGHAQGGEVRLTDPVGFTCRRCGDCCREVRLLLTPYDVWNLARELGVSTGFFLAEYTVLALIPRYGKRIRVYLEPLLQGSCPFQNGGLCGVYHARPTSCRLYPLSLYVGMWDDGETHYTHWGLTRGTIRHCPGINGTAGLTTVRGYVEGQETAASLAVAVDYGAYLNQLYLHYSVPDEDEHAVALARNLFDLDRYAVTGAVGPGSPDSLPVTDLAFHARYTAAKSETLLRFRKKPLLRGC